MEEEDHNCDADEEVTVHKRSLAAPYVRLCREVMRHSESTVPGDAFSEWTMQLHTRGLGNDVCVCGKKHIVELNSLENRVNSQVLYPVGSSCVKYFSEELVEEWKAMRSTFMRERAARIKALRLGFGKYASKTYEEVGEQDPFYAQWLMSLSKFATNPANDTYHPDNTEIHRLLQKGIDASTKKKSKCMLILDK